MDASSPELESLSLGTAPETLEQPPGTESLAERDYDHETTPEPLEELTEIELEPATPTEPLQEESATDPAFEMSGEFESIPLETAAATTTTTTTNELEPVDVEESSSTTPSLVETTSTSSPPTETPTPSDSTVPLPSELPAVPDPDSTEEKLSRKLSLDAKNSVANSKRRPSALSGVVSMTRQRDLPPKSKEEEKKHLRELEQMLTASKDLEKRRKSQQDIAHQQRMTIIAAAHSTWETSILPNWRAVLRPDAEGERLRSLWWAGSMPVRWRGRLWGMCVGNGLAVGKGSYANCLKKAQGALEEGSYDLEVLKAIEKGVEETMPMLKLFQKGGAMHDDLKDLLLAYSVFGDGNPHYPTGVSYPAAMFLINMPTPEAFVTLANLIEKSCLKSFYSSDLTEDREAYYRIFDTMLADTMPKVYSNFSSELVSPALYLTPWLRTTFIKYLPLDLSTRIFDVFLLEGDSFLFRIALVILEILEPRLFNPILEELVQVFVGEDRGAIAVVKRERGIGEEGGKVDLEDIFTEMGAREEVVFRLLEKQDWKAEMWERLVARELPDEA